MLRLVALACGLLCGSGLLWSGLFEPSLLRSVAEPGEARDPSLVLGLASALGVALLLLAPLGRLARPVLGGRAEPVEGGRGWRVVAGGLLFGAGWGLAGYYPLAALVALGLFAPGAAIFMTSVLGGMILHDRLTHRPRRPSYLG